jgi:hypothetical protein
MRHRINRVQNEFNRDVTEAERFQPQCQALDMHLPERCNTATIKTDRFKEPITELLPPVIKLLRIRLPAISGLIVKLH